MAIGGVCALAMGVSGAEFTFAPNVEQKPVTMSVESNTLVRLDLIRNLRDVVHDMELEDHNAAGTYLD